MRPPDKFFQFSQSFLIPKESEGVCFGICNLISQRARYLFHDDSESSFLRLSQYLRSVTLSTYAMQAQDRCSDIDISLTSLLNNYRAISKPPLTENQPYLLRVNITQSFGRWTRYSLTSYLKFDAYLADHACLIIGIDKATIFFDPNTGAAMWSNLPISSLDVNGIQALIDTVIRNFPVYLVRISKYWIEPAHPV